MNQDYSRLSTTHGHITDCKLDSVVYAGVCVVILMWTCFVWAERSTPDNFWVPSHRFNSATGEQKGIPKTFWFYAIMITSVTMVPNNKATHLRRGIFANVSVNSSCCWLVAAAYDKVFFFFFTGRPFGRMTQIFCFVLALLCAAAHQSYCHGASSVRHPSVDIISGKNYQVDRHRILVTSTYPQYLQNIFSVFHFFIYFYFLRFVSFSAT